MYLLPTQESRSSSYMALPQVQEHNGTVMMKTPALSFADAQKVLNQYRFAPFINPDFSPDITRVSFPDGYSEEFQNQISIPAVSHILNSSTSF